MHLVTGSWTEGGGDSVTVGRGSPDVEGAHVQLGPGNVNVPLRPYEVHPVGGRMFGRVGRNGGVHSKRVPALQVVEGSKYTDA